MLNHGIKKALLVVLALATVGEGSIFGASSMVVTYEVAGVMSSPVLSSYTYDFNSIGTGIKSNISWTGWGGTGNFSSVMVNAVDVYGGANNSSYTAASESTQTILNLSTAVSYFGMWWSAGDAGNILDFYNGGTKIFTFTSPVLSGLSSSYNGNPNSGSNRGGNSGEKYAFINFFVQTGAQIDKIIARGGGFESDNWTLRDPAYGLVVGDGATLPGTAVAQYNVNDAGSQTTVTDVSQINNTSVPEPSSLSLIALGLGSLLALRRCRKV
jgi:hypothetical protein